MLTGRLVTEETAPKASQKIAARTESSQALVSLLSLARKAEASNPRASVDLDRSTDPLAGIIGRPVLRSLLSAMQYRHPTIVTHGRRTARLAVALASHLGWDRPQLTYLELAALLHDLGKVGVPDNILAKPGSLSPDEAGLLAVHQGIALDVLAACRVHHEVLTTIAHAFPHTDPTAERLGRPGEAHVGGRILAVADAFDSLRTDQSYRSALAPEEALKRLTESDTRFDGNVVAELSRLAESTGPDGNALEAHPADCELAPLPPSEAQEAASLGQIFSYMYILESLYDGFTLVDADLRFVLASRGSVRLFDRPAHELHGKSWANRTLPTSDHEGKPLADHELPLNRVLASSKAVSRSLRMQATGGRWLDVEVQAVPLADEGGRLLGIAEIFRSQTRSVEPPHVRELKLAASRDPLTGLANRSELETQLKQSMKKFKAGGAPFSALFLDVDFFKRVNDNYGHAVGDEVLVGLAKLLRQECYSGELLARYGGEEFVVICPETDLPSARRRAERLRLAVSQSILCADPDVRVTASFGAAAAEPGDTVESLLLRADKALYRAKKTGRNRSCSFTTAELAVCQPTEPTEDENSDPFVYVTSFKACLASDMVVFKLGGFLREERAVLVDVAPGRAVIRMGSRGLFGGWGGSSQWRPVEVRLEFGDGTTGIESRQNRSIVVRVTVRPIGRIRKADVFKSRAVEVVGSLRSYFAASDA
ncbi:MAG: diguanylate cyclase [Planctomycetota bacterium]|nr:diguanylate cyclase [Planctomycetota bacterium]